MSHDDDYKKYLKSKPTAETGVPGCKTGKCGVSKMKGGMKISAYPSIHQELALRFEKEVGIKFNPLAYRTFIAWLETQYQALRTEALTILEPTPGSKNDGTAVEIRK